MEIDPIQDYFSKSGGIKPTLKELCKIFSTLIVEKHGDESYVMYTNPVRAKEVFVCFWDKKIIVFLAKDHKFSWRTKIISSAKDFNTIKDILISFLYCDTRKVPQIATWNDTYETPERLLR